MQNSHHVKSMCLVLIASWVGLQSEIVAFPGHTLRRFVPQFIMRDKVNTSDAKLIPSTLNFSYKLKHKRKKLVYYYDQLICLQFVR